jgi:hypothetical protein
LLPFEPEGWLAPPVSGLILREHGQSAACEFRRQNAEYDAQGDALN